MSAPLPDIAPPFALLAGLVRNPQEAHALVSLDSLAVKYGAVREHARATAGYQLGLREVARSLRACEPAASTEARLRPVLVLIENGLAALHAESFSRTEHGAEAY